jgi:hypothetical protein
MFVCSLPLLAAGYRNIAPTPVTTASAKADEPSDQECKRQRSDYDKWLHSTGRGVALTLSDACRAKAKATHPLECTRLFVDSFVVWLKTQAEK